MADYQRYQSDVVVDLLQSHEVEYIAINPGASFRGLPDSLVNYGDENPRMLVCQHEETAGQIDKGYAQAGDAGRNSGRRGPERELRP